MAKQKHFLVSRVIQPELYTDPVERVKIEAVFSKAVQVIAWIHLQDNRVWQLGPLFLKAISSHQTPITAHAKQIKLG
jgi:hypothetical protein